MVIKNCNRRISSMLQSAVNANMGSTTLILDVPDDKQKQSRISLVSPKSIVKSLTKIYPEGVKLNRKKFDLLNRLRRKQDDEDGYNDDADGTHSFFLLNPSSNFRTVWDLTIILALLYTAIFTPFEIAFLGNEGQPNPFAESNTVISVIFISDIIMNFFLPFKTENGRWEKNHYNIAMRYMKSGLLIDLVSVFPFEGVRVIRLLRLSKLLRIFNANRIIKRWETKYSINFLVWGFSKYILVMVFLSHWLACIFKMVLMISDPENNNWETNYFKDNLGYDSTVEPIESYLAALYWAVMTVTTIGYGDVVPRSSLERAFTIFAMLLGAGSYAYCVGAVCGLVASMSESKAVFQRKLDKLNNLMNELQIKSSKQQRLREYMYYVQGTDHVNTSAAILDSLTAEMRYDLTFEAYGRFVDKLSLVEYVPPFERERFIRRLCALVEMHIHPPKEIIIAIGQKFSFIHVIAKGIVVKRGSSLLPKNVESYEDFDDQTTEFLEKESQFGEEFLLSSCRSRYSCSSLTYVELVSISKPNFERLLPEFPGANRKIALRKVAMSLRINFVHLAKAKKLKPTWAVKPDCLAPNSIEQLVDMVTIMNARMQNMERTLDSLS